MKRGHVYIDSCKEAWIIFQKQCIADIEDFCKKLSSGGANLSRINLYKNMKPCMF
jgi:hypothetical protein